MVLLDEDADITGIQSDRETFFLDLCQPEISMSVPDEMKTLVQFLADTAPGELEPFFAFCRRVRDLEKNGTPLDCYDYTMLLSIFRADPEKVTDDRMRSWAVELFGNRRKKEAKAFLYDRLARVLTPQRLTQFLLKELPEDQKIESLGSPTKDLNGVKAIFLAQELWQRWSDDCKADSLVDKLTNSVLPRENIGLRILFGIDSWLKHLRPRIKSGKASCSYSDSPTQRIEGEVEIFILFKLEILRQKLKFIHLGSWL